VPGGRESATLAGAFSVRGRAYGGGVIDTLPLALTAPEGALYAAVIAGLVAIGNSAAGRVHEQNTRRRDLYSAAYKAALEWCEAIYRVRRRNPDGSDDYKLVERFHELQERIAAHEGWIAMESAELGRAYRTFLDEVLAACEPLIKEAWSRPGRPPTEPTPDDEAHPQLDAAKRKFVEAVRAHMAPWWNPPETPDRY
jgi:hypothetical protein